MHSGSAPPDRDARPDAPLDRAAAAVSAALIRPVGLMVATQGVILVVMSTMLVCLFCIAVVVRYSVQTDLFAYEEVVRLAAFWLYFLGSAQGSYEDSHIRGDFFSPRIRSPKVRWLIGVTASVIECLVLMVFTGCGVLMVVESVQLYPHWPATHVWRIPLVTAHLGILVGLILMALFTLLRLCARFGQRPPSPTGVRRLGPRT